MGDSVPQVPLAYGIWVCMRAYGKSVLKIEVRTRHRLSANPWCRRPGGLRGTESPVSLGNHVTSALLFPRQSVSPIWRQNGHI